MKVESNKTDNQIPKDKQINASIKSEQSTNLTFENYINSNTNQTKKDFASILSGKDSHNEIRSDDKRSKKFNENRSVDEDEKQSKTESKDKKEVREERRDRSNRDEKSDGEQKEKGFGQVQIQTQQLIDEISIPSGRSILHIADLERIISKIRSQNIANGKQVTIELKRSVFEGLQIKLTIGKDKGVIAEFIAANESVRSQLTARAEELAALLKMRGVKLTKLDMSLSSDSDQRNNQDHSQNESVSQISRPINIGLKKTDNTQPSFDSDTSYQV